jgi:hypothetical protein
MPVETNTHQNESAPSKEEQPQIRVLVSSQEKGSKLDQAIKERMEVTGQTYDQVMQEIVESL